MPQFSLTQSAPPAERMQKRQLAQQNMQFVQSQGQQARQFQQTRDDAAKRLAFDREKLAETMKNDKIGHSIAKFGVLSNLLANPGMNPEYKNELIEGFKNDPNVSDLMKTDEFISAFKSVKFDKSSTDLLDAVLAGTVTPEMAAKIKAGGDADLEARWMTIFLGERKVHKAEQSEVGKAKEAKAAAQQAAASGESTPEQQEQERTAGFLPREDVPQEVQDLVKAQQSLISMLGRGRPGEKREALNRARKAVQDAQDAIAGKTGAAAPVSEKATALATELINAKPALRAAIYAKINALPSTERAVVIAEIKRLEATK